MMRFSINEGLYRDAAQRLIKEVGANAQLLIREEARLLLRDVLAYTPPTKGQSQGKAAVGRDLSRVYATAQEIVGRISKSGDHMLTAALVRAMKSGDWQEFSDLLTGTTGATLQTHVRSYRRGGSKVSSYTQSRRAMRPKIKQWTGQGKIAADVIPDLHAKRRNAYGRVNGERWSQIVINPDSLKKYTKLVTDRVGWAKAGWNAAARLVGFKQPAYVAKLQASGGVVEVGAPNFSITLTNRASKIPNYQRTVNDAINRRIRSFTSEAARILRGGKTRRGSFAGTSAGSAD